MAISNLFVSSSDPTSLLSCLENIPFTSRPIKPLQRGYYLLGILKQVKGQNYPP